MRIPVVRCCSSDRTDVQNLTSAKNRCPEELNVLRLRDGAERRRQLQAKLRFGRRKWLIRTRSELGRGTYQARNLVRKSQEEAALRS